jgi:ABC-type phosphate/phosphonate transport system substrate-binding protein
MTEYAPWKPATDPRRWKNVCGFFALLFLLAGSVQLLSVADSSSADNPDTLLRVGFSKSMFSDVNENDVKAAMKVWVQVLMKEHGLPLDPQISVLSGLEEISRALRGKLLDAISLTTDEYWALENEMKSSHAVVGEFDGHVTEEYVLLVHRESGIERIGDLRGRTIAFFLNQRMSLASAWLDTLLVKAGMERASKHFSRITQMNKLPRVILPVFFHQNDACVVTRRGFKTMSELNPQVGQQLKIIASSPELVPAAFFFRGDFSHSIRDKALAELEKIHTSPAGQQALTVYQSGRLEVHPISILNSAFELLDSHRRLIAAASGVKTSETAPLSKEAKSR